MRFCICSYNRPIQIRKKTLTTLLRQSIPESSIFIFVGADSDQDFAKYETLASEGYTVIRVPVGLNKARNFVLDYWPRDEELVFVDDDVTGFVHVSSPQEPYLILADQCQTGFDLCKREGCRLWGAYPVPCKLWMAPHAVKGASFIQGCFFGLLNPGVEYRHELVFKEDWERTLWFYTQDEAVIRFESFAPVQKFRKNIGGLDGLRTLEGETLETASLMLRYDGLLTSKIRRGWPELYFTRALTKDRLVI